MDDQSFIKLYPKAFNFHKLLKTHEKIFENPRMFFLLFYTVHRCSQIETQLKIQIEDEHKVALKPSIFKLCLSVRFTVCLFFVSNKRQNS